MYFKVLAVLVPLYLSTVNNSIQTNHQVTHCFYIRVLSGDLSGALSDLYQFVRTIHSSWYRIQTLYYTEMSVADNLFYQTGYHHYRLDTRTRTVYSKTDETGCLMNGFSAANPSGFPMSPNLSMRIPLFLADQPPGRKMYWYIKTCVRDYFEGLNTVRTLSLCPELVNKSSMNSVFNSRYRPVLENAPILAGTSRVRLICLGNRQGHWWTSNISGFGEVKLHVNNRSYYRMRYRD